MLSYTVVLGVADAIGAALLRQLLAEHPRFELVGQADSAVSTLYLVEALRPSVVLMADQSPGLRGRDVLAEMAATSPDSLVIITTPEEPEALVGRPGVAESVAEHDVEAILGALNSLANFLDDPTSVPVAERRVGSDRRMFQDWTKVFAERRVATRRLPA